mgnify:CR=1 FL=1
MLLSHSSPLTVTAGAACVGVQAVKLHSPASACSEGRQEQLVAGPAETVKGE